MIKFFHLSVLVAINVIIHGCTLFSTPSFDEKSLSEINAWNNKMPFVDFSGSNQKKKMGILTFKYNCGDIPPTEIDGSVGIATEGDFISLKGGVSNECDKNNQLSGYFYTDEKYFINPLKIRVLMSHKIPNSSVKDLILEKEIVVKETY